MMGEAIIEHGGTLEHFAGDGVMIFFNDPVLQDDHVERAVRMAVAMRDRFEPLRLVAAARLRARLRGRDRRRATRRWAGSGSRAATTTAPSATSSSWPRA